MVADTSPLCHPDRDVWGEGSKEYWRLLAWFTLSEILRSLCPRRMTENYGLSTTGEYYFSAAIFCGMPVVMCHRSI